MRSAVLTVVKAPLSLSFFFAHFLSLSPSLPLSLPHSHTRARARSRSLAAISFHTQRKSLARDVTKVHL